MRDGVFTVGQEERTRTRLRKVRIGSVIFGVGHFTYFTYGNSSPTRPLILSTFRCIFFSLPFDLQ